MVDASGIGGLLSDPNKMNDLMGNPLFTGGMGLLSAARDKKIDPFGAVMNGLGASNTHNQQMKAQQEAAAIKQQQRILGERLAVLMEGGQNPGMGGPPMAPGQAQPLGQSPLTGGVERTAPVFEDTNLSSLWDEFGLRSLQRGM